ncbi:MAG: hypothetical protein AAFP19_10980 [Bacteroidota bacterium]
MASNPLAIEAGKALIKTLILANKNLSVNQPPPDDQAPVLGTWNRLYLFVLVLHAVIILLFYTFTRVMS